MLSKGEVGTYKRLRRNQGVVSAMSEQQKLSPYTGLALAKNTVERPRVKRQFNRVTTAKRRKNNPKLKTVSEQNDS